MLDPLLDFPFCFIFRSYTANIQKVFLTGHAWLKKISTLSLFELDIYGIGWHGADPN